MSNNLGIVLPMGQNKKLLVKSGQWSLWESEIELYKKDFTEVIIFEYRYSDWRRFWEAVKLFFGKRFGGCDVFKAVHLSGAIPCMIAKILWRKKYLLSYGYRYDEFVRLDGKWLQWFLFKALTPLAVKSADAVMVPTEELKKYILNHGAMRVEIIPNGVDVRRFKPSSKFKVPASPAGRQSSKLIRLLFVGRLEKQKNLEMLIRAIQKLQQTLKGLSSPNGGQSLRIKMIFVGNGSLKGKLIKLAEELDVSLGIMNSIPNNQLPRAYRQADIFVLPSFIEGHPKALLEAMACGLPCVASDIAGCREIITNNENGLLIKPTAEGIVGGLSRLIGNRDLRRKLGEKARATVKKFYDKEKLMNNEIKLLQSL